MKKLIAVLVAVPLLAGCQLPAQNDPASPPLSPELAFAQDMQQTYPEWFSPAITGGTLKVGRLICRDLGKGESREQLVRLATSLYSPEISAYIVDSATRHLCPQYQA